MIKKLKKILNFSRNSKIRHDLIMFIFSTSGVTEIIRGDITNAFIMLTGGILFFEISEYRKSHLK